MSKVRFAIGDTECGRTPGYPHGHDGIQLVKQLR
jgi:hypothetical protein